MVFILSGNIEAIETTLSGKDEKSSTACVSLSYNGFQ